MIWTALYNSSQSCVVVLTQTCSGGHGEWRNATILRDVGREMEGVKGDQYKPSWFKGALVEGRQEQAVDSHRKGYYKQNMPPFPAPKQSRPLMLTQWDTTLSFSRKPDKRFSCLRYKVCLLSDSQRSIMQFSVWASFRKRKHFISSQNV